MLEAACPISLAVRLWSCRHALAHANSACTWVWHVEHGDSVYCANVIFRPSAPVACLTATWTTGHGQTMDRTSI
eukprot:scaffold294741_cov37-Tisochrysis_lutea.AAC.1